MVSLPKSWIKKKKFQHAPGILESFALFQKIWYTYYYVTFFFLIDTDAKRSYTNEVKLLYVWIGPCREEE